MCLGGEHGEVCAVLNFRQTSHAGEKGSDAGWCGGAGDDYVTRMRLTHSSIGCAVKGGLIW